MLSEIRSQRVKVVVTFWFPLVCTGSLHSDMTVCVWHRFFNASQVGGFDSAFLSPFVREELRHTSMILILYQNSHLFLLSPYSFLKTPLVFFIWHNFAFFEEDVKNKIKFLLILWYICFPTVFFYCWLFICLSSPCLPCCSLLEQR